MSNNVRMCGECTREFAWEPRPGRPPARCPRCQKEHEARQSEPKPRARKVASVPRNTQPPTLDNLYIAPGVAERMVLQNGDERIASQQRPSYVTEFAQHIRNEIAVLEKQLASRRALLANVEAYV